MKIPEREALKEILECTVGAAIHSKSVSLKTRSRIASAVRHTYKPSMNEHALTDLLECIMSAVYKECRLQQKESIVG